MSNAAIRQPPDALSCPDESPGPVAPPGVVIERRRMLWAPAVLAAGLLLERGARASAGEPPAAPGSADLDWERFLALCLPAAREMVEAGDVTQDACLHRVGSYAARLRGAPETKLSALGGEAHRRNFEIEGDAPAYDSGSDRVFRIRETHDEVLAERRINTLSETRDNIHYFVASPKGARGIDITTPFGGDGSFSFIDFKPDRPVDPRRRTFEATWIGSKL